jgi:hypothetical protein
MDSKSRLEQLETRIANLEVLVRKLSAANQADEKECIDKGFEAKIGAERQDGEKANTKNYIRR